MRAQGFEPEDFEAEDPIEIWPENWAAWMLFCEMSTQWNSAPMGGYTGMNYQALFARMDRLGIDSADAWNDTFDDIRVLEAAALEQMRKND